MVEGKSDEVSAAEPMIKVSIGSDRPAIKMPASAPMTAMAVGMGHVLRMLASNGSAAKAKSQRGASAPSSTITSPASSEFVSGSARSLGYSRMAMSGIARSAATTAASSRKPVR